MQSMPSSSSSVKASPRLDRQSSTKSDKSKDDVIKCKPYANNLQWIVPKDGPSCEKDFVEVSHMKKSNTFPSDLSYSNKSTDENSRRQSDTSMNRDMVSGFLSRRGDTFGTGTTHSSKNPMVSEKGFFFPPPPQTFEPVMFSPRVVGNSFKPVFSANDTNPIRSNQACGTNIERYGSLDSMQCEKHSSNAVSDESNFENNLVSAFFRKRALRSNSDIPRSPSKQEIEEVRELIRKYHRSLSDPSFISPQKKAMLYEEKMINDLHTRDDVFEDPTTTSTPKYSDHRSMTPRTTSSSQECKDEIVRELLEHNHRMRKELVKRRLYQECEDLRSPFTGTDWQYDENITEVSRSVDIASLLVGELQRRTSDRKRHSTIPEDPEMAMLDRVDGGSNKSSPGNRDRFHENERLPQPPKSPLPSTSMVSPPSQRTHGEPSRKRKRGEINLRMTCSCEDLAEKSRELTERLRDLDHSPGKNCKCANIENEILLMANDAYSKIRRSDDSKQAMRQYQEEVNETNLTIFDSMSILCSIKALCKHGRTLEDVYPGSVIFVIRCRTVSALDDLWRMYKSGEIDKLFTKDFLTLKMKRKYGVSNVRLRAEIKLEEYWKVRKELDDTCSVVTLDSSFSKSDTEIVRVGSASKENFHRRSSMKKASMSNIAIVHMRSQSAPQVNQPSPIQSPSWLLSPNSPLSRDRKFSFNLTPEEQSPRVVFQELNFGSPTLKKVFDFEIALSSKTSPKRKTFAEPPPWETDENMYSQEFASPKRKNFGTNLDRK
ncbi:hypothetical protein FSP39_024439 [Pinctada imbricata]|uniref:Uncharacterized protein n=1 Tax=Pinctada imbricata TaxID=66713 RepID=A0AA88Y1Y5_PINIB|nr:hypothetical protein FSP39_024439 [Pinctada imbricata]